MRVSLVGLTCMYAFLTLVVSVLVLFVVRQVLLDFHPETTQQGSSESSSDKVDPKDDAHSSQNKSSLSSSESTRKSSETGNHSVSTIHRSQSNVNRPVQWGLSSSVDSIICGLDRWGLFVLITDTAITICCLSTLINSVSLLLTFLSVLPCSISGRLVSAIYQINKCSLYFIFLTRVDNIFSDTSFAYSKSLLRFLMTINLVGSLFLCASMVIFTGFNTIKSAGFTWCLPVFPPWIGIGITLLDLTLSVASMHMFISPLRKIYAMEVESQMSGVSSISPSASPKAGSKRTMKDTKQYLKHNSQVRRIALKCRLLTCTAVFSTFVAFVFVVFLEIGDVIIWEMLINNLSVVFMTTWVDDYYETVCFIPLKIEECLKYCCSTIKQCWKSV